MAVMEGGPLRPLTAVCASCQVDYYKARNLVIRGEVRGVQVEGRWFADERDLRRWKAEHQPQPAV